MPDNLIRPQLLPVLVSNLSSIYGVLFLYWDVADVFFWFWYEFALAGLITLALTLVWGTLRANRYNPVVRLKPYIFVFSYLMVLFYFEESLLGVGQGHQFRAHRRNRDFDLRLGTGEGRSRTSTLPYDDGVLGVRSVTLLFRGIRERRGEVTGQGG